MSVEQRESNPDVNNLPTDSGTDVEDPRTGGRDNTSDVERPPEKTPIQVPPDANSTVPVEEPPGTDEPAKIAH